MRTLWLHVLSRLRSHRSSADPKTFRRRPSLHAPKAIAVATGLATTLAFVGSSSAGEQGAPPSAPPGMSPKTSTSPPPPRAPAPSTQDAHNSTSRASDAPPPPSEQRAAHSSSDSSDSAASPDTRFAAAALLGFGTEQLNLGLGLRLGKTLSNRIYVGGTFVYHLGDSITAASSAPGVVVGGTGVLSEVSTSAFYVGAEGGYDFAVGPVVIRPFLGLGLAHFSVSSTYGTYKTSASENRFVAWPGGAVLYSIPDTPFFVGGDMRIVTIPGGPSFGLMGFGGLYFGS